MTDLISKQAALEAIIKYANEHTFNSYYKGMLKARDIVDALPSAEPKVCVPISVIEDIKAEIASMSITSTNPEDFTRTMAELYSFKKMALNIIDKHISGKEHTDADSD